MHPHSLKNAVAWFVVLLLACTSCRSTPPPPVPIDQLNRSLIEASRGNQIPEVERLLAAGATPDAFSVGTHDGDTALIIAARNGNVALARVLLKSGARVNLRQNDTHDGATPLIAASALGHDAIVALLLDSGANVHARTGIQGTLPGALYWAVKNNHAAAVNLLLGAGAVVQQRDLLAALESTNVAVVARLLEAGADPYWRFSTGRTVLEEAQRAPAEVRDKMTAEIRRFMGQPR